ncbi:hypothetical protein [Marinobacter caseinilyticus]|uniref:hypothetical protein n=1 Tax=Marinobacter caseinilyticus TaxID=2692195 RepID=UPI0014092486|nr:hypothetical protein [Marinobacter caseinilyticus]
MNASTHALMARRWDITGLANSILSPVAREVVHRWINDDRFVDASGEPAMLSSNGAGSMDFFGLVKCARVHCSPTRLLAELLGSGLVGEDSAGYLLLRRTAYAPCQPWGQYGCDVDPLEAARRDHDRSGLNNGRSSYDQQVHPLLQWKTLNDV